MATSRSRTKASVHSVATYLPQILAGLAEGGWLFLVASGLSLVFGSLRIVNFAHGSLYMVGAYLMVNLSKLFGTSNVAFLLSVVLAAASVAVLGAVIEIVVLRRIYRRPQLTQLIVTFGLVLIIAGVLRVIYGPAPQQAAEPDLLTGHVSIFGRPETIYSFFLMGLALVVVAGLWTIIYRTPLGRTIRAVVSDSSLLEWSGVDVRVLLTSVFMLGAFLAGMAGAVTVPTGSISIGADVRVIVLAFAVVIIGGLGSIAGALVGAVIVGLADSLGLLWWSEGSLAFPYLVLVAVLIVRPEGLFRSREVVRA